MENAALQTRAVECQQIALGISLRDYFAGQALAGFCGNSAYHEASADILAGWAYQQADAMLVVRNACPECNGTGAVDSGGYTPWGAAIDIPCGACRSGVIEEPAQLSTRGQLAMAAMQGMLAANGRGTAHVMARDAVAYADAMLVELKKEQKPGTQQMEAMRYTTAMHMLREISTDSILALVPNTGMGIGEFWDVVRLDHEVECKPYDLDRGNEKLWLMGRDKDPLNAVAQAQQSLEKEAST